MTRHACLNAFRNGLTLSMADAPMAPSPRVSSKTKPIMSMKPSGKTAEVGGSSGKALLSSAKTSPSVTVLILSFFKRSNLPVYRMKFLATPLGVFRCGIMVHSKSIFSLG